MKSTRSYFKRQAIDLLNDICKVEEALNKKILEYQQGFEEQVGGISKYDEIRSVNDSLAEILRQAEPMLAYISKFRIDFEQELHLAESNEKKFSTSEWAAWVDRVRDRFTNKLENVYLHIDKFRENGASNFRLLNVLTLDLKSTISNEWIKAKPTYIYKILIRDDELKKLVKVDRELKTEDVKAALQSSSSYEPLLPIVVDVISMIASGMKAHGGAADEVLHALGSLDVGTETSSIKSLKSNFSDSEFYCNKNPGSVLQCYVLPYSAEGFTRSHFTKLPEEKENPYMDNFLTNVLMANNASANGNIGTLHPGWSEMYYVTDVSSDEIFNKDNQYPPAEISGRGYVCLTLYNAVAIQGLIKNSQMGNTQEFVFSINDAKALNRRHGKVWIEEEQKVLALISRIIEKHSSSAMPAHMKEISNILNETTCQSLLLNAHQYTAPAPKFLYEMSREILSSAYVQVLMPDQGTELYYIDKQRESCKKLNEKPDLFSMHAVSIFGTIPENKDKYMKMLTQKEVDTIEACIEKKPNEGSNYINPDADKKIIKILEIGSGAVKDTTGAQITMFVKSLVGSRRSESVNEFYSLLNNACQYYNTLVNKAVNSEDEYGQFLKKFQNKLEESLFDVSDVKSSTLRNSK